MAGERILSRRPAKGNEKASVATGGGRADVGFTKGKGTGDLGNLSDISK